MLSKEHLKEVFNKASLDNNISTKEKIINKWVHRFGFDSLNDLLFQSSFLQEEQNKQVNQEKISLASENYKEDKQDQNNFKLFETSDNLERTRFKSKAAENFSNEMLNETETFDDNKNDTSYQQELPLPHINNLRKWINNKKAS